MQIDILITEIETATRDILIMEMGSSANGNRYFDTENGNSDKGHGNFDIANENFDF